jgi:hypothetical protein
MPPRPFLEDYTCHLNSSSPQMGWNSPSVLLYHLSLGGLAEKRTEDDKPGSLNLETRSNVRVFGDVEVVS